MTTHESKVLEGVVAAVQALTEEVHIHIAKTDEKLAAYRLLCDERHGVRPGRLAHLETDLEREKVSAATTSTVVRVLLRVLPYLFAGGTGAAIAAAIAEALK